MSGPVAPEQDPGLEPGRDLSGPAGPEPMPLAEVDWGRLRTAADQVARRAYAPYSRLSVGAAALAADGRVVTGCNVEAASYGLTLCAECGLVSAAVAAGALPLLAVSVSAGDGEPLAPCGRCRQLLMEHGGPALLVDGGPGHLPTTLGELLPGAFSGTDLSARRQPPGGGQP